MQSLKRALSSPPPASSTFPSLQQHTTSTYDQFMQEPYCAANCFDQLRSDSSNFGDWLACLNRVLCVAFNLEMSIYYPPSSIDNCSLEENRGYELEGLLAQVAFHSWTTLNQEASDQLITTSILAKGEENPMSTFLGKVILNMSTKSNTATQQLSPFVYRVVDPPISSSPHHHCQSPHPTQSWFQVADVRRPPDYLVNKFWAACFHFGLSKDQGGCQSYPKTSFPFFSL
ncbi:hypothetical protein O181_123769 [Austropuccinia psidii MF-1]|uniref:Uncharacterized protein n=1 Tax=Austropuccinia psidii MF-1 TaxID=1389203 RepID=A0A9Q3KN36_9BASI|nr:hypothetical protein [Austropuccinia psidii MF-1]